ncbi:hypothetical protein DDQ50_07515 [Amnibacterium flavum]|uniref:Uncharacterized protein n=2 Tax=Amnibacterium flavum TaxID=2173173 RepID=A0A2V1HV25_9MICO|nr:hypothetical protein DDQ50_07515 [Amnibacterium flavum]
MHGGPWAAGFGWLFFLIPLFWIGILALLFAVMRRRFRGNWGPGGPGGPGQWAHGESGGVRAAEKTLAERFARGDIDEVEYRARLEVLRAG